MANKLTNYSIVFDGGAIGNPGHGYGSFEISEPSGVLLRERLEFGEEGERMTNNEAEYLTLVVALERLLKLVIDDPKLVSVSIHGDSALVINQVNGKWKIRKPHLQKLRDQVVGLLNKFGGYELQWHSRLNSVWILGH
jgi:ribonuclease HI